MLASDKRTKSSSNTYLFLVRDLFIQAMWETIIFNHFQIIKGLCSIPSAPRNVHMLLNLPLKVTLEVAFEF